MSRSYRIRIRESLRRVIRATDHVSSQLELLEILPPEQMGEILAGELAGRGFQRQGQHAVRKDKGTTVLIDLDTGAVTVRAEGQEKLALAEEREARVYDDVPTQEQAVREQVGAQLRQRLESEATAKQSALQKQVTERLEGQLADIRQELDQAVNRATATALKQKAAQMGQIKSVSEEPNGSLTIVVEV